MYKIIVQEFPQKWKAIIKEPHTNRFDDLFETVKRLNQREALDKAIAFARIAHVTSVTVIDMDGFEKVIQIALESPELPLN